MIRRMVIFTVMMIIIMCVLGKCILVILSKMIISLLSRSLVPSYHLHGDGGEDDCDDNDDSYPGC